MTAESIKITALTPAQAAKILATSYKRRIDEALVRESLFKLRLHVDFDDFEEIVLFRRGEEVRMEEVACVFGLLHGFGFAAVLQEIGLMPA